MTLREAQNICMKLDGMYMAQLKQVKWNDVYETESDIIKDLANIYIPKNRTAPAYTFKGWDFIYSFAYYVKKGWTLSEKQMTQCKRLALEIRKAAAIADYEF